MRFPSIRHLLLAGLIVLAAAGRLTAQSTAEIVKQQYYAQNGATTSVLDRTNGPFGFQAYAAGPFGETDTFTVPGTGTRNLPYDITNGGYRQTGGFGTQAALDATYPDGPYALGISGISVPLNLTGATYPNVPLVTASNGAWTGVGVLSVNPAQAITLTVNFTTNFNPGAAAIDIQVSGPGYSNDVNTDANLSTAQLSTTIPAGTIQAGGQYQVVLTMDNLLTVNTAAVPGYEVASLYETKNTFLIQAQSGNAPVITAQPISQTIVANTTTTFAVSAFGSPAPTYQWYFNGNPISGSNTTRLLLSPPTALAGSYTCQATNIYGSATTSAAILTVLSSSANPGRLGNLSVLTLAGNGAQPLTLGFEVGGAFTNGTQTLLVRGDGPLLAAAPFTLTGTLADPVINLFPSGSSTALATDDNWGSNQAAVSAAEASTFAYPLTAGSLDAALVSTLAPGAYSVQITGNPNGTGAGLALAEVYDDTAAYTTATPRLINLSCLAHINASGVLTAGFVIGGLTSKTALVRASGPALQLAPFNLTGVMPDPQLTVHANLNGQDVVLAANAGWGGNSEITQTANLVYAFAWTNHSSSDSAVLLTLPPGSYTAQVSSVSGVAGTALVEVYEVP
jgi:hypothetical protein